MEYTRINQIPGLMVAIDFEKAFQSISWNFLLKALKSFNLGESFINGGSLFFILINPVVSQMIQSISFNFDATAQS